MSDETTSIAVQPPAVVAVHKETFLQRVEDIFEDIGHGAEDVGDAALARIVAGVRKFDAAFLPAFETFVETLASQVGQAAGKAAIGAIPLLAAGGWQAAVASVGTAAVTTAVVDAPVDAQQALQATQAALQVVKVSNGVVTTGDEPQVTAIAAAVPAAS